MPASIKHTAIFTLIACLFGVGSYAQYYTDSTLCGHTVVLDADKKILPWSEGAANAYDHFLRLRWGFVETKAPQSPGPAPRSSYPQYYFYCAYIDSADMLLPDMWMNDVGEKIPNWFESALSFYAYTGDIKPLTIVKGMIDYLLRHGITSSAYSWPNFPQSASDAGATEFRGFTTAKRFSTDDVQVDHCGDIGATFYRAYLFYGNARYKQAAINVANVLAKKVSAGSATQSPWPYVVNTRTGKVVSDYGSNWFGCFRLLKMLVEDNAGDVKAYQSTYEKARQWVLQYPAKNGLWVDGHTDNLTQGTRNLSNMSASNVGLFIADFKEFDTAWKTTLPSLIKWTEQHFVDSSAPGEPSNLWGANLVSEQVDFMPKMDYQTARYAAQCAGWYAVSGDEAYKDKAFRALNFVTYCNDSTGEVFESPVSKGVHSWWSDSYGEGPRMFYHVFAAIPEWAPAGESHILYSRSVLNHVVYGKNKVEYTAMQKSGADCLRVNFKPKAITLNGKNLLQKPDTDNDGYTIKQLQNGDYAIKINRLMAGTVFVNGR